jgi:hypothetical protein
VINFDQACRGVSTCCRGVSTYFIEVYRLVEMYRLVSNLVQDDLNLTIFLIDYPLPCVTTSKGKSAYYLAQRKRVIKQCVS